MSQPPVLFRPCYRERKREVNDVEMAIATVYQLVRAPMELRRELYARYYRGEPSRGMAVCERRPAGQLLPGRSDGRLVRSRHYGSSIRRLRSMHAAGHDDG